MIFQYFRSIRVLFSVFLGIILLFVYLGFHFYQEDKIREFADRSRELGSIARLKQSAVNQWYSERYADARYIYSNESIRQILNSGKSPLGDSSKIVRVISSIYRNHDYSNLFMLNPATNDKMQLNPYGSDDIMKDSMYAALKDDRIVNSDFYIDKNLKQPCLDLYVPITLSNESKVVVVLKVDPYKILFPAISNWYMDASSGESLIVTSSADSIYYVTPLRHYRNSAQVLKKSINDFTLPAAKGVRGALGAVTGKDYRGAEVLADVRRIEHSPWFLITKMDLTEVYEPVTSSTFNSLLIIGLLISLGGILLLYFYTKSNYDNLRKISETEKKFKNIFDNAAEAIVLINKNRIVDCNPGAEKLYGLPKKKIIGETPGSLSPEYQPGNKRSETLAAEFINKALEGEPQKFEWIHTRNGRPLYTDITLTTIEVDGETIVSGFLHDISKRKLIENALFESEKSYRSIFDLAPVGIYQSTHEGKFIKANKALANLLGYDSEDELCRVDIASGIYSDKNKRNILISEFEPTGSVSDREVQWKKKDGTVIWVQLNAFAVKDEHGNTTHFEGYVRDITSRKLAGEHIQTLTKAIEQSPVCVVITDLNGTIRYVNNKFTEVTGYQMDEVINENPRILKSGSQNAEFYKQLWETILSGNTWEGELHNKKKNGELYWENAIISPIVDAEGKILNFVAVKEDITEKKKMIEDLVKAKDKAEEANRLKSSFLANMSHELRTPMVGILGYTDILVSELSNPEHIELAKMVLSSGRRLIDTLNSILDLSSIEARKMELKSESVDVVKVLKESIELFIPNAASKGLYLKSILPDHCLINSDREILGKIFNNLINNAVKYTQSGGIAIELSFTGSRAGKYLIVSFTDTGIGISAEYHELIFEPFRQVSEGYTRKFEGSGLGLSITNKLVKMLEGSIFLESTPGKGSRFTVKIPVIVSAEVSEPEEQEISLSDSIELQKDLSILLVEDDELNADIILSYLKPLCSADHAADGELAVEYCRKRRYDLILMDINLKGMNGIEAMEIIRKLDKYYLTVPILAVTALAMAGDREKLLSAGFNNYLSKPFERRQLLNTVSLTLRSPVLKIPPR